MTAHLSLEYPVGQNNIFQPDSTVVSDGLACFSAVQDADCHHISMVSGGELQRATKK